MWYLKADLRTKMLAKNSVRLTKRVVDAAVPRTSDFVLWDADVPGFGLCVRKSGRKAYLLKYRVGTGRGAKVRKPTIGTHGSITVDQARGVARDWLAKARLGEDPSADRRAAEDTIFMSELFNRYLEEHARVHKKSRSADGDESMIVRHLQPALGVKRVADITRTDISLLHKSLSETPYLANRLLALLSKVFNLAEWWELRPDGSNPCRHVRKFKEEKRRRFLSELELADLGQSLANAESGELKTRRGAAISIFAIAALRLLILTGARKGEILSLRWSDVNLDAGRLELSDSKTGAKFVYLPPHAVELVRNLPRLEGNDHVIPGAKRGAALVNLKDPWDAIRRDADIEDVRIHDLRHTFASFGAANGMSLPILGALLGHREASTTARYAHLADDPLRSAADAIGSHIAQIMASQG